MELICQLLIRNSEVLLLGRCLRFEGVIGKLLGILGTGWYLDWASESKIGVTLLVNELLNFPFGHSRGVHYHFVMDWKGSSSFGVVVCDHEEIEVSIDVLGGVATVLVHNDVVNHGSRSWINYRPVHFLKESGADSLVDKNMEYLWVVII
jgi:hypothetical protein